jgi:hypothetical protein
MAWKEKVKMIKILLLKIQKIKKKIKIWESKKVNKKKNPNKEMNYKVYQSWRLFCLE